MVAVTGEGGEVVECGWLRVRVAIAARVANLAARVASSPLN